MKNNSYSIDKHTKWVYIDVVNPRKRLKRLLVVVRFHLDLDSYSVTKIIRMNSGTRRVKGSMLSHHNSFAAGLSGIVNQWEPTQLSL